jgi:hypothetical protein
MHDVYVNGRFHTYPSPVTTNVRGTQQDLHQAVESIAWARRGQHNGWTERVG